MVGAELSRREGRGREWRGGGGERRGGLQSGVGVGGFAMVTLRAHSFPLCMSPVIPVAHIGSGVGVVQLYYIFEHIYILHSMQMNKILIHTVCMHRKRIVCAKCT